MLPESSSDATGASHKRSQQIGRKRRLAVFSAAAAFVVVAVLIWSATKSTADLTPAVGASEPPGVPVTAVSATQRDIAVLVEGLGTVQAFNTVTIKPRVSGQILDLAFVEGQELQQGAVVAHIDPRPYAAALRQAQGNTAKDEAQLGNAELGARLKAAFSNDDRALKPGQFVNAQVHLETLTGAVTLPTAAVQTDERGSYVYVIGADKTAEQRRIRVARSASGVAVIAEGLRAGEQVVLDGQFRLKPGSRVTVQAAPQTEGNRVAASLPGFP